MTKQPTPDIISVTGTKGKTTVTRLLSHIFTAEGYTTLRVDTDGHYLNEEQRSTKEDSEALYGLLPATCPGKFLYELRDQPRPLAVLETAYLSGSIYGMGYFSHDIGIFTNVFEDHLGKSVSTPEEMAIRKSRYIFTQISPKGTAIFNADDPLVCANLDKMPHLWPVTLLPVGLNMKHFDIDKHFTDGGYALTMQDGQLGIQTKDAFVPLINPKDIAWAFDGLFKPSLYNLLFVLAALFAHNKYQNIPEHQIEAIKKYQPSQVGGRLTVFKEAGITVIADYAHEKNSLREVGQLAKELAAGKSIGVLRLQPSRADELIIDTGKHIANDFDQIYVYDKVDGVHLTEFKNRAGFVRKAGETSRLLYNAIKSVKEDKSAVEKILVEEEAIEAAIKAAQPGDVIVHIVNDDHTKSVGFIKKYLQEKADKR